MIDYPILAASFIMNVIAILFLICCMVLILVILIQKGKGGGLSGALGASMASGILGSKTGDFLTWVTIVLVGLFLLLGVLMAKFWRPSISDFGVDQTNKTTASTTEPAPEQETPETPTDANTDANKVGR